jgi:hypothetical protein
MCIYNVYFNFLLAKLAVFVQADSMAYSANFAGGSGKPTPPAVYLQVCSTDVQVLPSLLLKICMYEQHCTSACQPYSSGPSGPVSNLHVNNLPVVAPT